MTQGGTATRMNPEVFRSVMSFLPTGLTVVTAPTDDGPVGCTVNAVTSLSLSPPSLLVSLLTSGSTLAAIKVSHAFGVNVLAWRQREMSARFASGPADRRFDGIPCETRLGVPMLRDAMAGVVCSVTEMVELADHHLVIGEPNWYNLDDSAAPVVFFRNRLRRIGHW